MLNLGWKWGFLFKIIHLKFRECSLSHWGSDWLICRLIEVFIDLSIDWLIDLSIGWLVGWLIDWRCFCVPAAAGTTVCGFFVVLSSSSGIYSGIWQIYCFFSLLQCWLRTKTSLLVGSKLSQILKKQHIFAHFLTLLWLYSVEKSGFLWGNHIVLFFVQLLFEIPMCKHKNKYL